MEEERLRVCVSVSVCVSVCVSVSKIKQQGQPVETNYRAGRQQCCKRLNCR